MPDLVDKDTPPEFLTRTGFDGQQYDLVFSDEFNTEGRTFYPGQCSLRYIVLHTYLGSGDDPYWTAVDLWYGVTADLEWYDPGQVTTRNGALVIRIDEGPGPGSGSGGSHNLTYRSGMLQSWNQFCFTGGYIEVSVTFPGPSSNTLGYVSLYTVFIGPFAEECFSGQVLGRWVTWDGLVIQEQQTVCGHIRRLPIASLLS